MAALPVGRKTGQRLVRLDLPVLARKGLPSVQNKAEDKMRTAHHFERHPKMARLGALLRRWSLPILLLGCGEAVYDEIELMPSPTIYTQTDFSPFPPNGDTALSVGSKLFYVTDRDVAGPDDKQPHYTNERGQLARAGTADVVLSPRIRDWDQFVEVTLQGKRDRKYLLGVDSVSEIGVLPFSVADFYPSAPTQAQMDTAGRDFAAQINAQLATSPNKDVHIYVHGYNVDFEYSTLVGREIEHFLGYQGAFIVYNWAATPNTFAYFRDQESATATRRNLRSLIEFLSDNTRAERINLIGYSAGSRLAFEVTYQIALLNRAGSGPRLGNVILVSSDLDRSYFGHSLVDGVLDAVDRLSVYTSGTDSALAMSSLVFGRDRLGQGWDKDSDDVWPALEQHLVALEKLEIIDVTDAEESSLGNGHSFFRTSPWASSDIFMSLLTSRSAPQRGLVRPDGDAVWRFPDNYPQRLQEISAQ